MILAQATKIYYHLQNYVGKQYTKRTKFCLKHVE